jgi:hypothetical protein
LDPWHLDEGPISKSNKLRLNLHGTILEGKSIGLNPPKKNTLKKRAHDLKNQDASQVRCLIKDSILLQMSPNWFLRIWTLDPIESGPKESVDK